jgi:hypothetical protein
MDAILAQTTYPPSPSGTTAAPPSLTAATGAAVALPVTGLGACLVVAVALAAVARRRARSE